MSLSCNVCFKFVLFSQSVLVVVYNNSTSERHQLLQTPEVTLVSWHILMHAMLKHYS